MHEYFLHRARKIIAEYEAEKDKTIAMELLQSTMKLERDKVRHIVIDLLKYRYPGLEINDD